MEGISSDVCDWFIRKFKKVFVDTGLYEDTITECAFEEIGNMEGGFLRVKIKFEFKIW